MCIIAVCYDRRLTQSEASKCFLANPDGAGFAWAKDGQVHFRKGLMSEQEFAAHYRGIPLPHIVHFRAATTGGIRPELTHPFICSPDAPSVLTWSGTESVLFQNGHWTGWKEKYLVLLPVILNTLRERGLHPEVPIGPWSDTRALASLVGALGTGIVDYLASDIGTIAVLDCYGQIATWGWWYPERGVQFSNLGYRYGIRVKRPRSKADVIAGDSWGFLPPEEGRTQKKQER